MALINIYEDSLTDIAKSLEVKKGTKIRDIISDYISNINSKQTVEVYDPATDTTQYVELEADSYNCIVIVDGHESDLDFVCKKNSIVNVTFYPTDSWNGVQIGGTVLAGVGVSVLLTAIIAASLFSGGIFAGGTVMLGSLTAGQVATIGAALTLAGASAIWAGSMQQLEDKAKQEIGENKVSEKLLTVNGGSNESIIGKPYPLVLGKHLINPYIIGTPYHFSRQSDETVIDNPKELSMHSFSTSSSDKSDYSIKNIKNDHKDLGQWFQALYCVGYAPLKLTDFKIGETHLAYNKFNEANGSSGTILHGKLTNYNKKKDIVEKWKNNDVEIEILQAGDTLNQKTNQVNKWGSIYPVVVKEDPIEGGALLYAYDNGTDEVSYNGYPLKVNYRTNTVHFSKECPYRLEVDVEMPNGYFGVRQENTQSNSTAVYVQPPINLAVQWRFTNNKAVASDAEDPLQDTADNTGGWHNFSYELLTNANDNSNIKKYPVKYTDKLRKEEITYNKGLSNKTATQSPKWVDKGSVFQLNIPDIITEDSFDMWQDVSLTEILDLSNRGVLKLHKFNSIFPYYTDDTGNDYYITGYKDGHVKVRAYVGDDDKGNAQETWTTVNNVNTSYFTFGKKATQSDLAKYRISIKSSTVACNEFRLAAGSFAYPYGSSKKKNVNVRFLQGQKLQKLVTVKKENYSKRKGAYTQEHYNINARRYTFVKEFSPAECVKFINANNKKSDFMDCVEVRVIRVTPCYIDQAKAESNDVSAMTYSDITKWTYLRTWSFDKDAYTEAVNKELDKGTKLEDIKLNASDYPLRPIPEDDLNKFCYVALRLKQDVAETGGSSLKKLNLIAESLLPKFDLYKNKWSPVKNKDGVYEDISINSEYRYYYNNLDKNGVKKINILPLPIDDYDCQNFGWVKFKKVTEKGEYDYYELNGSHYDLASNITDADIKNGKYYIAYDYVANAKNQYEKGLLTEKFNSFYRKKVGTDFFDTVKKDVFSTGITAKQETVNTYPATSKLANLTMSNYYISDEIHQKYITRNTSSAAFYSLVGSHLKQNAKDLSQIELSKFADFYRFCNDVTDGSEEDYVAPYKKENELPKGFYAEFKSKYEAKQTNAEIAAITTLLSSAPVNAVWSGCYDYLFENLIVNLYTGADKSSHLGMDLLDTAKYYFEKNNKLAAADGKLHLQYNCNGVLSSETKLEDLFYKILVTGRAYYRRSDDNKYEPIIGRPNYYPVTVLNQRNVISKNNARSFEETISGYQVSYIDEFDNYETNTFYVMDDGEDYRCPTKHIEQFSIPFITNPYQMKSISRFNLACKLYQRESYTRTVGDLGYAIGIGDLVLLQDDSLLIGTDNGGRIKEILQNDEYIFGFITDDLYKYTGELDDNDLCVQGVTVVQPGKYANSRCVTLRIATENHDVVIDDKTYKMKKGLTNIVLFETPIIKETELTTDSEINGEISVYKPQEDNLVAFGKISQITTKAIVMGIKPKDKGFELTLSPYNDKLYEYGEKFPYFNANMTTPNRVGAEFNFTAYQTTAEVAESLATAAQMTQINISEGNETLIPDDVKSLDVIINNPNYIQFKPLMENTNTTNNNIDHFIYQINRNASKNVYIKAAEFDSSIIYRTRIGSGTTEDPYLYPIAEPQPVQYYAEASDEYDESITYYEKDFYDNYVEADPQPKKTYRQEDIYNPSHTYYIFDEENQEFILPSSQPSEETFNLGIFYIYDFRGSGYYVFIDTFSERDYYIIDTEANWQTLSTNGDLYYFDRNVDGYPEKYEDFANWNFRCKAVNYYLDNKNKEGNKSKNWTYAKD